MLKAHPYRAVVTVLAVMFACGFVAGMIGQYNDGPWGELPAWLGALTWFGFLASALVMVLLSLYLLVAHVRWRKDQGPHRAHVG